VALDIADQIRDYVEAAAPAISLAELAELAERRTTVRQPAMRARVAPRRAAVAVGITAAVVAATGTAIAVTELPGSQPRPTVVQPRTTPSRPRPSHVLLTAAMVHRLQRASKAALAASGHVFVRYSDVDAGLPDGSGTMDITFSGQNFNAVSWQPGSKIGPWIERVVDGQIYDYGELWPGQRPQWRHSTTQTSGGQAVPDPRTLLQELQPSAAFELLGTQLIDGVETQHLRATKVSGLQGSLASLGLDTEPLTSLDVWVDSNGVVRQMAMVFSGNDQQGDFCVDRQVVSFLDIGKPETITAPTHYVNQVTHG
jgi:hypothetical protein